MEVKEGNNSSINFPNLNLIERLTLLENEIQSMKPFGAFEGLKGSYETNLKNGHTQIQIAEKYEGEINRNENKTGSNMQVTDERRNSKKRTNQSYAEGLTLHDLSRIATGGPRSKTLWSLLISASFIIAILISKEHWDAFLDHDSRSSTKIVSTSAIDEVPPITICNNAVISKVRRSFDGESLPKSTLPTFVNYDMNECADNLTQCGYQETPFVKVQNITVDYAHKTVQNNLAKLDNETGCFTVAGEVQEAPSNLLSIQIVAKRLGWNEWTAILINPVSESFPESSKTFYWATDGYYHANIEKRIITRLGMPYGDCVEGTGSYARNKFTGNYTVMKCQKGCLFEEVFKRCGGIPTMYKKYLRQLEMFQNETLINNTYGQACLGQVEEDYDVIARCNLLCDIDPCYEEDIKLSLTHIPLKTKNFLDLDFTFQSFMIEMIEEKPAYRWQDLFANFGGCVGLMTGASILSVIELLIFVGLIVCKKFNKFDGSMDPTDLKSKA